MSYIDGCIERSKECGMFEGGASRKSVSAGWVELLQELMDASAPYLQRKKMTPRHQCNALNEVWAKCAEKLEKPNEKAESEAIADRSQAAG